VRGGGVPEGSGGDSPGRETWERTIATDAAIRGVRVRNDRFAESSPEDRGSLQGWCDVDFLEDSGSS